MNGFVKAVAVVASLVIAAPLVGCAGGPKQTSTGEQLDDTAITAKVKTQLFRDPDVSGFQVNVETFKGQVQLSGFVDTAEQKKKAEQIAKDVAGVRSVQNNLVVKAKE